MEASSETGKIPVKVKKFLQDWVFKDDGVACFSTKKQAQKEMASLQEKHNFSSPEEMAKFLKGRYIWEVVKEIKLELRKYSTFYKRPSSGNIIIVTIIIIIIIVIIIITNEYKYCIL